MTQIYYDKFYFRNDTNSKWRGVIIFFKVKPQNATISEFDSEYVNFNKGCWFYNFYTNTFDRYECETDALKAIDLNYITLI